MNNEIERLDNADDQNSKNGHQVLKMISSDYGQSSNKPFNTDSAATQLELEDNKPESGQQDGCMEETPLSPISAFNSKVAMATGRQENTSLPAIAVTDLPIHRTTSKSVSYSSSPDGGNTAATSAPPKKQTKQGTIAKTTRSTRNNMESGSGSVALKKSQLLSDTLPNDYQPSDPSSVQTYVPLNKDALLYELAAASTTFSSKSTSTNTPPYSISSQNPFAKSSGIDTKPSGKTSIGQQFNSIPNASSALIASSSLSTSSSSSSSSSSPSSTSFLTTTSTENNSVSAQTPISSTAASVRSAGTSDSSSEQNEKASEVEKRVKPCHLSILPSSPPLPPSSSSSSSLILLSGVIGANVTDPSSSSSSSVAAEAAFASTGTSKTLNQLQSMSEATSSQITTSALATATAAAAPLAPSAASSLSARLLGVDDETKLKYELNKELLNCEVHQQQQPLIANEQQQQLQQQKASDDYEEKNTRSPPPPSFAWSTSSSSSSSTTSLSKHVNESSNSSFYRTVGYQHQSQAQHPQTTAHNPFSIISQEASSNVNFDINDGSLISPSASVVAMKKRYNSYDLGVARHKDAAAHQHDSSASSSSVLSSASTLINQEDTISNSAVAAATAGTGNQMMMLNDKMDTLFMPRGKYRNRDFDSNLSILMSDDYGYERFGQQVSLPPTSSNLHSVGCVDWLLTVGVNERKRPVWRNERVESGTKKKCQ